MATCRTCAYLRKCIEKATKEGYEHNVDFDASSGCPNFGFKSKTNADRIRAMSDEVLMQFLFNEVSNNTICSFCVPTMRTKCKCDGHCKNGILEWLKQPAEGE